ncbi:hypothetical protein [Mycobacterium sp. URHB0021]
MSNGNESRYRGPRYGYHDPIDIEARENRRRRQVQEDAIFRSATLDINPEHLAVNQEWWDVRMTKPLVGGDDGIDPDRYEVEEGAEIIGDVVLRAEEEL